MLADDEEDHEGLGTVGYMSDSMISEALFWRIVIKLCLPLSEVDKWSLQEMRMACAFIDMQNDYKRIWHPYYDIKNELQ